MSPKLSVYTKSFNKAKCMSFLIKHDELLEKYNKMWDKLSNSIKKRFDSEPIFNEKYIKNKIKSYESIISTIFWDDWIPKESSHCIFLSVTFIAYVSKNYYR